jgi:hypothetical protein
VTESFDPRARPNPQIVAAGTVQTRDGMSRGIFVLSPAVQIAIGELYGHTLTAIVAALVSLIFEGLSYFFEILPCLVNAEEGAILTRAAPWSAWFFQGFHFFSLLGVFFFISIGLIDAVGTAGRGMMQRWKVASLESAPPTRPTPPAGG